MALEWPDFEAQAKKKKAAKRRRQKVDGFIVPDSDADSSDEEVHGKGKKKKNERELSFQLLLGLDAQISMLPSWTSIPNRCTFWFLPILAQN
jgi:hypothetical protein